MKTDELIHVLASSATAVDPHAVERRIYGALGWGLFVTTLLMAVVWGVRPDMGSAAQLPMFWFKLALPAMTAFIALKIVERIGRPGMRLALWPWLLMGLLAILWISGSASWITAPPQARENLLFSESWQECVISIAVLSIPLTIAAFWAMKGLAPTEPAQAGAASGLLAGSASATVYALHCTEMALPFIAVWYVLGILVPAFIGYLLGKRWLRW